jgi:hypothetical protein
MLGALSMGEPDPNARLRERRRQRRRRQIRIRRAVALGALLALGTGVALGARAVGGGGHPRTAPSEKYASRHAPAEPRRPEAPVTLRGVHVTMALASLPGRLDRYLGLPGLNAIELDVKDEDGHVGPGTYYDAKRAARVVHAHGIYLIGRVVTFEDPVLSARRPELAIRSSDGTPWLNSEGLGWTNPYDRRVWRYNVDVAAGAARAGFDEIQFDYVRFPSDGDLSAIRYPGPHPQPMRWTIPAFVQYASRRLHPLGVRVSVDVFGLSATRDLGIGQLPRRVSAYVDAVYPMVYPSHYSSGEYGIAQPDDRPGLVVSRSLSDFRRELEGRRTRLTPWLQDFSLGRSYTLQDVRAQIAAAQTYHTNGFLLWNPEGVYTREALAP